MINRRFVSLKRRFVLFTGVVVLAAVATEFAVSNYFAGNIIISQVLRLNQADTRFKAHELSNYFQNLENDVRILAYSPELDEANLTKLLTLRDSAENAFQVISRQIIASKPEFVAIAFVSASGQVLFNTGQNTTYFKNLSGYLSGEDSLVEKSKLHSFSVFTSSIQSADQPFVEMAASIFKANKYMGTVRALVDLRKIFDQVSQTSNLQIVDVIGAYLTESKQLDRPAILDGMPAEKIKLLLSEQSQTVIHAERIYTSASVLVCKQTGYKIYIVEEFERKEAISAFSAMTFALIFLGFVILLISIYFSYVFADSIVVPIQKLRNSLHSLLEGRVPEQLPENEHNDEVGQLTYDANLLFKTTAEMATFARYLGAGDFSFQPSFSAPLLLSDVLLEMRDKIASSNELKNKENWVAEGINYIEEVLHLNLEISELYQRVLDSVVSYIKAEQGAIYLVENENLVLQFAHGLPYAKIGIDTLSKGEDLAGQVWQEGKTLMISDIPADAEPIASGLGKALPSCIVAVALKAGIDTIGVLEIASFKVFQSFEISFVERIAQTIAVSYASIRNNQKTKQLMYEAQNLADRLKTQEEQSQKVIKELLEKLNDREDFSS